MNISCTLYTVHVQKTFAYKQISGLSIRNDFNDKVILTRIFHVIAIFAGNKKSSEIQICIYGITDVWVREIKGVWILNVKQIVVAKKNN